MALLFCVDDMLNNKLFITLYNALLPEEPSVVLEK